MFAQLTFRLQNIAENQGLGIALTGMLIVFSALLMITLFIATLPRLLAALADYLPEEHVHHATTPLADFAPSGEESVAVAIGYALHARSKQAKSP